MEPVTPTLPKGVSLRSLTRDDLEALITAVERNRDPARLAALRSGNCSPISPGESLYLDLLGELEYRDAVNPS